MKAKWMKVVALSAIVAVLFAGVALADTLNVNDVVTGGNTTKAAGTSGSAQVWIAETNGTPTDDRNGCNAGGIGSGQAVTVQLQSNNSAVTFPSGNSATFENCGVLHAQTIAYSVSSAASAGSAVISSTTTGGKSGSLFSEDSFTVTITVAPSDSTPPVIGYTLNPTTPDGSNGWYQSAVSLTWTVTENESPGSLVKTGCVDQNIAADQASTSYSCSAASDGGSAGPVSVSIKKDGTAPSGVAVQGFTNNDTYDLGSTLPTPTCATATDATSGIASATSTPTVVSDTRGASLNGVGTVTLRCSATDEAGNSASDQKSFTVQYGGDATTGFKILQPINSDNSSAFNRGRTIPVKFKLAGDEPAGFNVTDWRIKVQKVDCTALSDDGTALEGGSTSTAGLRYDASNDQYIYNLDMRDKAAGTCWKAYGLFDNLQQTAASGVFKLTK